MKKLFALIVTIAFAFTATACSISINTSDASQNAQLDSEVTVQMPTSAIEALNSEELQLFNSIIAYSKQLVVPSSIKVVEVYESDRFIPTIFFRLNAQNSFGGEATEWFMMNLRSGNMKKVENSKELSLAKATTIYRVKALNRAIEEYYS